VSSISDEEFNAKEEDILLKLSMPKRELRPSTVKKMQEANQQQPAQPQVPQQVQVEPQQTLTQENHTEIQQVQSNEQEPKEEAQPHKLHENVDVKQIENITRQIMNRDLRNKK
jgi:hypothetical protein